MQGYLICQVRNIILSSIHDSLPTPSYRIVDMRDSDLIPLLNKIGMSIDAEWVIYFLLMLS